MPPPSSSSLGTRKSKKNVTRCRRYFIGIVVVAFGFGCFRLVRFHSLLLLYNNNNNKDGDYNHKSNHEEVSSAEQLVLELLEDTTTTTSATTSSTKPRIRQQQQQKEQEEKTVLRSKPPPTAIAAEQQQVVVVSKSDDIYKIEYELPIVIEKYKLIFFVIPKVASTTFKILLHKLQLGPNVKLPPKSKRSKHWPRLHFPRLNKLTYLNQYNITEANRIMTDPEWTRAIFFRNPHERLLSVFLDKGIAENFKLMRGNCCPKGKHDYCIGSPTSRTNDNDQKQQIQLLDDFVTLLETTNATKRRHRNNKKKQQCLRSNNHWKPQSERVPSKVWPYINFIGHMENLNEDMELLMQRIHSPLPAATLLSSPNSTTISKNITTTITADDGDETDDDDKRRRRKRRGKDNDRKKKDAASVVVDGQHHATDSKSQVQKYYTTQQLIDRVTGLYQQDYDSPYLKLNKNLIPKIN